MKNKIIFFTTIVFTFFLTAIQAQNEPKRVQEGEFYGLQNQKGEWLIEPKYDFIDKAISDSFFVAQKNGLLGLFDITGRQRMPTEFTDLEMVGQSGRIKAKKKDTQFGLFDTEGQALTFMELSDFQAETSLPLLIFAKYTDGQWAVLNRDGRHLHFPPLDGYSSVSEFSFLGKRGDLVAVFLPNGNRITDFKYHYVVLFNQKDVTRKRETAHRLSADTYFVGFIKDNGGTLIDNFGKEYPLEPRPKVPPAPPKSIGAEPFFAIEPATDGKVEEIVYDSPEKPAMFPGGDTARIQFIKDNMEYSKEAKRETVNQRTTLKFMVDKDGSISRVMVLRDPGFGCGKAAVAMVRKMPAWIPAEHKGRVVQSFVTLDVVFRPY